MAGFFSKEQYDQACSVDLYEFLLKNHSYAVKVEYGSVLLLADKHVSVKKGFHGYRNFRTGETGNNPFRDQPILRLISEKDSSKSERRIYPIFP